MKKHIAILAHWRSLLVLLALLLSTACATAPPAPATADQGAAAAEATTAEASSAAPSSELEGKLTVTFWGNENDVNSQKAAMTKFMELHPKVEIEVLEGSGCGADYAACKTMIAGGTMVDVFVPGIWNYNAMVNDGVLTPIEDLMQRDNVKVEEFATPVIAGLKAISDGKIYGLPMGYNVQSLYFNKDMFDAAGLAYPDPDGNYTWDDVRNWAKTLTLDENGKNAADPAFDPKKTTQWGYATLATVPIAPGYEPTLLAFGGSAMKLPDRQTCNMEDPKSIEGWQFIQDMLYKDNSTVTPDVNQEMAGYQRWVSGQVAMQQGSHEQVLLVAQQNPEMKYDMAALPKGSAGNASVVQMHIWSIWSGSENKELAWELIKWLATDGTCGDYGPGGLYSNMMGLIPAYGDLANGECFAKAAGEPEHVAQAQLGPLDRPLTTYPTTYNQKTDMINGQDGFGPALTAVVMNEQSAAEALAGVCATVDDLMIK